MIDKLKAFKVAWVEFVEWMKTQGIIWDNTLQILVFESDEINFVAVSGRELFSLCIEWLDSKGIYMCLGIDCRAENILAIYKYQVYWLDEEKLLNFCHDIAGKLHRPEATEAGICKGFEIRNNQLNQKEK